MSVSFARCSRGNSFIEHSSSRDSKSLTRNAKEVSDCPVAEYHEEMKSKPIPPPTMFEPKVLTEEEM